MVFCACVLNMCINFYILICISLACGKAVYYIIIYSYIAIIHNNIITVKFWQPQLLFFYRKCVLFYFTVGIAEKTLFKPLFLRVCVRKKMIFKSLIKISQHVYQISLNLILIDGAVQTAREMTASALCLLQKKLSESNNYSLK